MGWKPIYRHITPIASYISLNPKSTLFYIFLLHWSSGNGVYYKALLRMPSVAGCFLNFFVCHQLRLFLVLLRMPSVAVL